ncbi:MAG: HU family DNA-binding protein [Clostridia bacterium]
MNKTEFIREVAVNAGSSIKDAGVFYDAFIATLQEELKKGEKVTLVGFGTFSVKNRAARTAINPMTKKEVKVAACRVPALKFGKGFKEIL